MEKFKNFIKKEHNKETGHMPNKLAFEKEFGLESGGTWSGSYTDGMNILQKYFNRKFISIPGSLKMIESVYGPVRWTTSSIRVVITRYYNGDFNSVGTDVTIDGVDSDGKPVQFRYMQGPSRYSGYRMYRYNNSSLRLFTTLGSPPDNTVRIYTDRARDRAPSK